MAELTGADAEHLVRVLRAEVGQVYEICDNEDVYVAEIETARKSVVVFRCKEKLAAPEAEATLVLVPALFKFDRFEWLIEKATELGVARIQPFEAVRTERGLAEAAQKRCARWERIAVEASQQARRNRLPVLDPVETLAEALAVDANVKLLLDEDAAAEPILRCMPEQIGQRHSRGVVGSRKADGFPKSAPRPWPPRMEAGLVREHGAQGGDRGDCRVGGGEGVVGARRKGRLTTVNNPPQDSSHSASLQAFRVLVRVAASEPSVRDD